MSNVHHHPYATPHTRLGALACGCHLYRCNDCGFTRPIHEPPCPIGTGTSEAPVPSPATSTTTEELR